MNSYQLFHKRLRNSLLFSVFHLIGIVISAILSIRFKEYLIAFVLFTMAILLVYKLYLGYRLLNADLK